jgi:branched-chain amino acid transport system substrate-binding protein
MENPKKIASFGTQLTAVILSTISSCTFAQSIVIGQTIDLSGGAAEHGKALTQGAQLVIDSVNADGGVRGRKIVLRTLDDKGSSDTAKANTTKLIEEERVIAMFNGAEGGPCVAQTQVASALKVPVIACAAGAPDLRDPFDPYSFPVRAAHVSEFEKIIETATTLGRTRFALLHSDSDTGRKHLANVKRLLAQRKLELVLALPITKAFSATAATAALAEAKVEVLLNHGAYKTVAEIYQASRVRHPSLQVMAVNSGAQQMVRLIGEPAKGIVFTQVVPFPWSGGYAIVREYELAWKKAFPNAEYSFSSMEGFINAKVLVQALRRTKSFSSQGVLDAMETLTDLDLGGFRVRYGPNDRTGSRFVDTVIANRRGGFSN